MSDLAILDRVWVWYLLTVTAAVVIAGGTGTDGDAVFFVALQLGLLAAVLLLGRWLRCRSHATQTVVRATFGAVALPVVFSSLGLVLPAVHPEPFEWTWIAWDRALLGVDPTRALQALAAPWFVEILQWCYAAFYLVPVMTLLGVGACRGRAHLDRGLLIVVFCFLLSYLLYLLWPTLPPYRFLPHGEPLRGVWLGDHLHAMIDEAELHRWDCFPSGHTMLSLVCIVIAWRWTRPLLWALAPVVALLVLSTLVLRYHYLVDVMAGGVLVLPSIWFVDWLAGGRPGAEPATGGGAIAADQRREPR